MKSSVLAFAMGALLATSCGSRAPDRRDAGRRARADAGAGRAVTTAVLERDSGPVAPLVASREGERLVPEGIARIAVGTRQSCALGRTGRVFCWGGHGLSLARPLERHRAIAVPGISDGVEVTTGDAHACVLHRAGKVSCWGRNVEGQLGDGSRIERGAPVAVVGVRDAIAVSAGGEHTCVVRRSGAVSCFGHNEDGQLGDGTTRASTTPVAVLGLRDAIRVSAGPDSTCAVRRRGSVMCWGSRGSAAFGVLDASPQLRPLAVAGLTNAVDVVTGNAATCAIDRERTLVCVGQNNDGRLSPDRTLGTILATPQRPIGNTQVRAVALMVHKTCVLDSEGAVRCWSGDPRWARTAIEPQRIGDSSTRFEQLAGTYEHLCALRSDGAVLCTGQNYEGQLGREAGTDRRTPNPVAIPEPVARVYADGRVACATTVAGHLFCWGADVTRDARRTMGPDSAALSGLGLGSPGSGIGARPPPYFDSPQPHGAFGVLRGALVGERFLCGIESTGIVRCLGDNTHGQLGEANPAFTADGYVTVHGLSAVQLGSARGNRACVVQPSSGEVLCWGERAGAEGTDTATPVRRAEVRGAIEVALGDRHACALLRSGVVRCWGDRAVGQLGDGVSGADAGTSLGSVEVQFRVSLPPAQAGDGEVATRPSASDGRESLGRARHVAAGGAHSCAITQDGTVWCWGAGFRGQLGDGGRQSRSTPVQVHGIRDAEALGIGPAHGCAATQDGALYCWGYGRSGQLGVGSSDDHDEPVRVPGLTGVTSVAAGEDFTCAVHGDPPSVSCWGASEMGALGGRFGPGPGDPVMSTGELVRALW